MKLWTVYSDYAATGEGRTIQALITYAQDEAHAIDEFAKRFNAYFARGADVEEGVVENELTTYLFSANVLETARKLEGKANVSLCADFHFNLS